MNLKKAVGISLIIFILVFGNIIAFGYFGTKLTKVENPINSSSSENTTNLENKTKVNSSANISKTVINETKNQTTVTPKPTPSPPPVTRAS